MNSNTKSLNRAAILTKNIDRKKSFKLLVILFIIKLYSRKDIFKELKLLPQLSTQMFHALLASLTYSEDNYFHKNHDCTTIRKIRVKIKVIAMAPSSNFPYIFVITSILFMRLNFKLPPQS